MRAPRAMSGSATGARWTWSTTTSVHSPFRTAAWSPQNINRNLLPKADRYTSPDQGLAPVVEEALVRDHAATLLIWTPCVARRARTSWRETSEIPSVPLRAGVKIRIRSGREFSFTLLKPLGNARCAESHSRPQKFSGTPHKRCASSPQSLTNPETRQLPACHSPPSYAATLRQPIM
jgi:hypothetical protein